jgi:hypothetical protein
LTVAVQRLVLILPVEERDLDSFCGGEADTAACADLGHGDDVVTVGHDGQTDEVVAVVGHDGQADEVVAVVGHDGQADEVLAAGHSDQVFEGVHAAGEAVGLGDQVAAVGGNSVKESFRSCQMLRSRCEYEDYEKTIYFNIAKAYDWSEVDDVFNKKEIFDENAKVVEEN